MTSATATATLTHGPVSVATRTRGRIEVPAIILGPLAVTPFQGIGDGWNVTHIGTGKKIGSTLLSQEDAICAMRLLLELDPEWKTDEWSADKWAEITSAVHNLTFEF